MKIISVGTGLFVVGIATVRTYDGCLIFPSTMAFTSPLLKESQRPPISNMRVINEEKADQSDSKNYSEKHFVSTLSLSRRTGSMDIPYHITIVALRHYLSIHGNLVMPRRFVVPMSQGYPNEWVGLDLAATVYTMKWWKKNIRTEETKRVSELNNLGFVWERLQPEWNIVLEALITYHALHGHVIVPNKFVVPYGSTQWPKATWGIPLGNCVYRIRSRNDFLHGTTSHSRRSQLDSLHFVWDVHEQSFLKFYAILRHFAKLSKTGKFTPLGTPIKPLKVPATYKVPAGDERWPQELWNYQLGAKCVAVRQKDLYVKHKPKRQRMLEDLGFRWCGNAELSWLKVVHAAAIYSRLNGHSLDVPYKFVVPSPAPDFVARQSNTKIDDANADNADKEWPWPHYLWNLPLGQRIKEIRITGAYLKGKDKIERIRQLDALGFVWDVREYRRQQKQLKLQHSKSNEPSPQLSFQEASI
jgi:hypothetical protein